MLCSSLNNIQPVMPMTHSSCKVCQTSLFDYINSTPECIYLTGSWHAHIVPSTTRELPEDYVERVKCVHEHGGYGSRGYDILSYLAFPFLSSHEGLSFDFSYLCWKIRI